MPAQAPTDKTRRRRDGQSEESKRRILDAATRLFAEHGFEGVSTRRIASEAGLNIATVHHHLGSKRDVFLAVIERCFEQETALLEAALTDPSEATLSDFAELEALIFGFFDRLLTFCCDNPHRQRLYLRRWLDPQDEMAWREAELSLELYAHFRSLLARAQALGSVRGDLDVGYFLRSVDWMVMTYFTAGAFDWKTLRADPTDEARLVRFRDYLRDYARSMLKQGDAR